ncbi:MAG: AmmeMemoRadiSam system protein B [Desulfatibacillaceae bacterium]
MGRGAKTLVLLVAICVASLSAGSAALPVDGNVMGPRVAGVFYPADRAGLEAEVMEYLERAAEKRLDGRVRAVVAPHAGYKYSGIVAAAAYKAVPPDITRVVLLAPSHRHAFSGVSIPDVRAYRTPLGDVPLAWEASLLRLEDGFSSEPEAHAREHSLEVHLPFLQIRLGEFELIPIVFGRADPVEVAEKLLPYLDDNTLVVASTDLSHYHPYEQAVPMDKACTKAMASLDMARTRTAEACGRLPVLTLQTLARTRGWRGHVLDYKNSGDTSGDKMRVVGYAAIAFISPKGGSHMSDEQWTEQEKTDLLKLARSAIAARLGADDAVRRPKSVSERMLEPRGCFVTLHKNGDLRGCIGNIEPVQPLVEGVEQNAVNAAFRDPRFPPLGQDELDRVHIEISVLTVPEELSFTDGNDLLSRLEPGVHGVILSQGMRKSTFLPQVWDQLPDKEMFLTHLCQKAGMGPNCWKDPATRVETYKAYYFEE